MTPEVKGMQGSDGLSLYDANEDVVCESATVYPCFAHYSGIGITILQRLVKKNIEEKEENEVLSLISCQFP